MRYHIAPIFICPPNAENKLLMEIARHGEGYTYLLSRAGVTGTEQGASKPLQHLVETLTNLQAPPALQGFGISTPDQVSDAIQAGAMGAISGSAIVKIIEKHREDDVAMLNELRAFVMSMKAATRRV